MDRSKLSLHLLLLYLFSCSCSSAPLTIGCISAITGGFTSNGGIPAVDMALEHINNRSDILQNYTLDRTEVLDSNCNRTVSLNSFFKLINSDTTFVSLLGCGCSTATLPVAEISHYWNIPQMSFASAAYDLNDRVRFRNFFRSLPTQEHVGASLAQLMRVFGWKQMAVITQDEELFKGTTDSLASIARGEGWILDTSVFIKSGENPFPYGRVFDSLTRREQFRIIFFNTYPNFAYTVLCEAYYREIYYPKYLWILPGWYDDNWWNTGASGNSSCTNDVFERVLNGTISALPNGYFILKNETMETFSGLTPGEFTRQYTDLFQLPEYRNYTKLALASLGYDGAWAIAIGLDIATKRIAAGNESGCENLPGDLVPLEYFNYTNEKLGCIMKQSFSEVHFLGLTGMITFNENGSRPDNVLLIKQYRTSSDGSMKRYSFGQVVITSSTATFNFESGESNDRLWIDGEPPYDGYAESVMHSNNIALIIIYSVLAFAGLILAQVCFIFNIVFRNRKVVKLTSPKLNYLIILGAALLYVCIFFYANASSSDKIQTVFCNIRVWLFSLGYTLCFAVILSKTWRTYYIFNNPTPKKKAIKDRVLLVIVVVVVSIDLAIILIGSVFPQSRLISSQTEDIEHPRSVTDDGKIQNNYVFVCAQRDSIIWLSLSFGYKGLLQILAMFMAFHTRRVKVKVLNESKEIAAIIYINSIVLVLLAVTEFTLASHHNAYAGLFALGLLVEATLFLGLVFIPKMFNLHLDPKGEKIFTGDKELDHHSSTAFHTTITETTDRGKSKEFESK